MSRGQAHLLLLLAAAFWGFGAVAQKTVLQHVGPLTAVGLRCFVAVLLFAPLLVRRGGAPARPGYARSLLRIALLFSGALVLQQAAFATTTVTNASFLVNTGTVMTPFLAVLLLREAIDVRVAMAAATTLLGAALMSNAFSGVTEVRRGDMLCLLSAALYAGWMVALSDHLRRHTRPFEAAAAQFALAAALALPLAFAFESPSVQAVRGALPELLVLALFSTACAFGLQIVAQRHTSTSAAAVVVAAESLFGALAALLVLGERTPPAGLLGAALIGLAIVAVAVDRPLDRRPRTRDRTA